MPEEAKRISVQIFTESPQTRAWLRKVVAAAPGLELRDGSARDTAPDVVILDPEPIGDAPPREPPLASSSRTLVLTDRASEEWVRELLGTHSAGVIGRSAQPAEIIAAIEAVAAGLVVFSPSVLAAAAPPLNSARTSPLRALPQDPLTPRETEVLRMLADGLSNKEVARQLHLSEHTVKYHLSSVFGKLGVSSRTEAVMAGIQRGIILI